MFRKYLLHIVFLFDLTQLQAQSPTLNWQVTIGGSEIDYGHDIFQIDSTTSAYAPAYRVSVVGRTASQDGTVINCAATDTDAFFTQIDTNGVIVSCTTLGGSCYEEFNKGKYVTSTSGQVNAVLLGRTCSNDRDVSGNHGSFDAWMVRTDFTGNVLSKKCIGGKGWEDVFDFVEMPDKGFLMCGVSSSDTINGIVTGNHGGFDGWIVRTDSAGNIIWSKQYGGSYSDFLYSIIKNHDGNYTLAGFTNSSDGNIIGSHGLNDYWVIKIDGVGNLLWQKVLGGSKDEYAYRIFETDFDYGIEIAGFSESSDGDVIGNHSVNCSDTWIVKMDSLGNTIWSKCYGGGSCDFSFSFSKADNNSFILLITPNGWSNNPFACQGTQPFKSWLVKIDSVGNIIWYDCFGTIGTTHSDGFSECIIKIDNSHYCFISHPYANGGNVSMAYGGSSDIWLAKIQDNSIQNSIIQNNDNSEIKIYPNPATNELTIKFYELVNANLTIKNLHDQVIFATLIYSSDINISLTNLTAGIYILDLRIENKIFHKKFIKTN